MYQLNMSKYPASLDDLFEKPSDAGTGGEVGHRAVPRGEAAAGSLGQRVSVRRARQAQYRQASTSGRTAPTARAAPTTTSATGRSESTHALACAACGCESAARGTRAASRSSSCCWCWCCWSSPAAWRFPRSPAPSPRCGSAARATRCWPTGRRPARGRSRRGCPTSSRSRPRRATIASSRGRASPIDDRSAAPSSATTTVDRRRRPQRPPTPTGDNLDGQRHRRRQAPRLRSSFKAASGRRSTRSAARRRVDPLQASSRAAWSTPILFFPDGTASQATVVLQNDRSQYVRLTIRGLTGVARASARPHPRRNGSGGGDAMKRPFGLRYSTRGSAGVRTMPMPHCGMPHHRCPQSRSGIGTKSRRGLHPPRSHPRPGDPRRLAGDARRGHATGQPQCRRIARSRRRPRSLAASVMDQMIAGVIDADSRIAASSWKSTTPRRGSTRSPSARARSTASCPSR